MAYEVVMSYHLHMPSYFLGTFTEYPSFNAKIKLFRANLRGVADKRFFLFRIAKLYAYPH